LLTPSETHPEGFPRWTIAAILAWGLAFGWQLMRGERLRRPKEKTSVVFVHGILSSGDICWRSTKGSYWPQLLEEVPYLKALGIYVFTYQTGIFSGSYSLLDVVDALKEHMRLDRVAESDSIVFVCHSMGGIVVRKYIVDHAVDLIQEKKTVGLFLVAFISEDILSEDLLSKPLDKKSEMGPLGSAESTKSTDGSRSEPMPSSKRVAGVTIGNVSGGIHGSVIAGETLATRLSPSAGASLQQTSGQTPLNSRSSC
jgi:hypothetical protein